MARITLYDVAPSILGMFDRELVKCVVSFKVCSREKDTNSIVSYTENTLRREGVRIRTGHHVERVERVCSPS